MWEKVDEVSIWTYEGRIKSEVEIILERTLLEFAGVNKCN